MTFNNFNNLEEMTIVAGSIIDDLSERGVVVVVVVVAFEFVVDFVVVLVEAVVFELPAIFIVMSIFLFSSVVDVEFGLFSIAPLMLIVVASTMHCGLLLFETSMIEADTVV